MVCCTDPSGDSPLETVWERACTLQITSHVSITDEPQQSGKNIRNWRERPADPGGKSNSCWSQLGEEWKAFRAVLALPSRKTLQFCYNQYYNITITSSGAAILPSCLSHRLSHLHSTNSSSWDTELHMSISYRPGKLDEQDHVISEITSLDCSCICTLLEYIFFCKVFCFYTNYL